MCLNLQFVHICKLFKWCVKQNLIYLESNSCLKYFFSVYGVGPRGPESTCDQSHRQKWTQVPLHGEEAPPDPSMQRTSWTLRHSTLIKMFYSLLVILGIFPPYILCSLNSLAFSTADMIFFFVSLIFSTATPPNLKEELMSWFIVMSKKLHIVNQLNYE